MAVCNDKGFKWFVNSRMRAEKYVGQWRENPEWNLLECLNNSGLIPMLMLQYVSITVLGLMQEND
ncbi:hypothetical protein Dsin_021645 [Dipteronia sinensis]|uniref:Uncharacterized protein n=1 Tax=Dipteronia sinensis TaxID=43782 RepID=A0AAE0A0J4_9ROSI|nr:hypothetical protein Dsin_021645 [Dipteronia sinensis]